MSIRDAQKIKMAVGYCLLLLSLPAVAAETTLTKTQSRDPFSTSRSINDQENYPSVLTSSEFESSVTGNAVAAQAQVNVLKTPVIPEISTGIAPVKNYALTPTSSIPSMRALVLHENVLLSQGLNQWAKDSGYKMLWNSSKDYIIYSTITYTGATADDVLGELGKLFASENYGLVIKLYQKNRVLLVDEQ